MKRSRVAVAVLALLAVLSLSVAAATLDSATGGTGVAGVGEDDGAGVGDSGDGFSFDVAVPSLPGDTVGWLFVWIARLVLALFALASVAAAYLFYHEHGVRGVATLVGAGGVFAFLVYWLLAVGGDGSGTGRNSTTNDSGLLPSGGAPGTADGSVPATDPPTVLAIIFALALVGALAVFVRATGDDEFVPEPEPMPDADADTAAIARTAGAAADRIARGAVVDNEIYRAWREMTGHLDVANPDASTPSEFATAAIDAGFSREDVETLTALFEGVRYGGAAVTGEGEEQAVSALRNIEEEFACD